ncbi:hypothetical protein [Sulfobacillus harzensis]|uniref:Uncharacterized protein n=1 Tax=Sulfobacillus harzensis TaxID=2729629 RepID=A0A7Y0L9B9_9FIRM|nr:hypothetical protein [Sulfobacillus harzensis]NMP24900.1 hypothetical protein [Sulfobacillus harzensis]
MFSLKTIIPLTAAAGLLALAPATGVFAATTPAMGSVTPVARPDIVDGQTIPIGYRVGDSIIYPSAGGYSILANPKVKWTPALRKSYIQNRQQLRDLLTFASSAYSHSPEAQKAGPVNVLEIEDTLNNRSIRQGTTNASQTNTVVSPASTNGFDHYTFSDSTGFTVGSSDEGLIQDNSVLTAQANEFGGTGFENPNNYLGWRPNTTVTDVAGTNQSLDLSFIWTFHGWSYGLSYPSPSVAPTSTGGTWNSGTQYTWQYTWAPSSQPIYASPGVESLTGTTEQISATINSASLSGAITGYSGFHTIGWMNDAIEGNG